MEVPVPNVSVHITEHKSTFSWANSGLVTMTAALPGLSRFAFSKSIGALLLTAGIFKAVDPAIHSAPGLGALFLIGIASLEIGLAIWIFIGCYPQQTQYVLLLGFSGLLGAALLKAFRGDPWCGCFGEMPVNPWWTVLLDGLVVGALIGLSGRRQRRSWYLWIGIGSAALFGTVGGLYDVHPISFSPDMPDMTDLRPVVVLADSTWEKNADKIIEDAEIEEDLTRGEWVIMLHRSGCPICGESLDRYRQLALAKPNSGNQPRFALLVISGKDEDAVEASTSHNLAVGRVSHRRRWIVRTPFFLHARDGRIYRVTETIGAIEDD